MTVTLFVWSAITSLLVVGIETLFVAWHQWVRYAWVFVPLAVAVNFGVYKMVTAASNLPTAFVVFATINLTMRTVVSLWVLAQPVGRGTWVAIGCYGVGVACRWWLGK